MGREPFANAWYGQTADIQTAAGAAAWTKGRSKPGDGGQLVVYAASFPATALDDGGAATKIDLPLALLEDVK